MDMSPYRDLFVSEANGHLSAFSELIVHLEDSPGDNAAIAELFRHAHSLKGMAATMGYEQVVDIAHHMENLLSNVRSGEWLLDPLLTDLLLDGGDTLTRLVDMIENGDDTCEDTTGLVARLSAFELPSQTEETPTETTSPVSGIDLQLEETASAAAQHQFRQTDHFKSIRIKTETLDHLVNITGELITNRYRLEESVRVADAAECREPLRQLTALLRNLRDEVFKARMLPFSFIADRFPRLVRDLARKQGKEISFQLTGKDIELDRSILEEIADPIVHLLRNAVDHGLETAEEREQTGKPRGGTIILTVSRDKDHVEIIIDDDGRGMDPERLKRTGIEKGIISADQAERMTSHEAYQLICKPGFSTAATVTDISGRGVGMDAVREAVHTLNGNLVIQSRSGHGSRFVMRLPITVSIIHALIVESGPFEIAFPLNTVSRTLELRRSELTDESGQATITLDGLPLPLRSLRQALELPSGTGMENDLLPVIVCSVGGSLRAFSADHISGQQEIFVRPLNSPLSQLKGMSGATVTGDGRVLFIADVAALA